MIAQLLSFLFISITSLIIGAVIKQITKWSLTTYYDFLIGFTICNALFTLISIFYPLSEKIEITFITLIFLVIILFNKWLVYYFKNLCRQSLNTINNNRLLYSMALVFIIFNFFKSLYPPFLHFDASFYHIQTIQWITEYPTLPGLSNLFYAYGYNFNIFTWYAIADLSIFFDQPIYAINFTLTFFFILWICSKLENAINNNLFLYASGLLLLLYCLIYYYMPHISTTSNNTPVFILITTVLISVVDSEKSKNYHPAALIILAVYVITIKLSAAPIILIVAFLLTKTKTQHSLLAVSLLCCFVGIPWLIKNIILTGYLIFPFPDIDLFTVDWKVPIDYVRFLKNAVKLQAQNNIEHEWIQKWLSLKSKGGITIIFLVPLISILLMGKIFFKKIQLNRYYAFSLFTSICGILFMFYYAPDLIYGLAFFVTFIVLSLKLLDYQYVRHKKYLFYILITILSTVFVIQSWYYPWHFVKNISQRYYLPYPLVNDSKYSYFLIDNSIKCYYPIDGLCNNHTLPCTYINSNVLIDKRLHLRGASIQNGFKIDKE
jgi:hypothetical protein